MVVKEKEYNCKNRYCYVYNVLQIIPEDMETTCHNCNMKLKRIKT